LSGSAPRSILTILATRLFHYDTGATVSKKRKSSTVGPRARRCKGLFCTGTRVLSQVVQREPCREQDTNNYQCDKHTENI